MTEGIRERSQIQAASFAQMRSLREDFLALRPIPGLHCFDFHFVNILRLFSCFKGGALFVESIYLRSAKDCPKANHTRTIRDKFSLVIEHTINHSLGLSACQW